MLIVAPAIATVPSSSRIIFHPACASPVTWTKAYPLCREPQDPLPVRAGNDSVETHEVAQNDRITEARSVGRCCWLVLSLRRPATCLKLIGEEHVAIQRCDLA